MWFKSAHLCLLHHRFSPLWGLFLWSQRKVVNSPNREPHLLIPFSSSATAKFLVLITEKPLKTWHHFLKPPYSGFAFTTLPKLHLTMPRLTAQSSGQFQSSHTCPLGSIELFFPSNFYFACLLRTTPPTSFTSSSLPHLLIPPLKKKKNAFLMLGLHEAWLLCLHHSLFNIISLIVYFHGFRWQLTLTNHKYKYFV